MHLGEDIERRVTDFVKGEVTCNPPSGRTLASVWDESRPNMYRAIPVPNHSCGQSPHNLQIWPCVPQNRQKDSKTDISLFGVRNRCNGKFDPIYNRPLRDCVSLWFRARHPMLYRRQSDQHQIAVIYVESTILNDAQVGFTDANAASRKTRFLLPA